MPANLMRRIVLTCLACMLANGISASAQTLPRATVSVGFGVPVGGAAAHLEDFLDAHRFGADEQLGGFGFQSGPQPYPDTYPIFSWTADLRVRVRPRLSLGLSAEGANSITSGRREGPGLQIYSYDARHMVMSIAPTITWHARRRWRVGGGPALSRVALLNSAAAIETYENQFGWLGQTAFAFVDREAFFLELAGAYVRMGRVSVPAVTVPSLYRPDPGPVSLPATDIGYSHWTLGVNIGLKIP